MLKLRKQMKSKKLPVEEPVLNVYPHHANLNAILLGSDYDLPMVFNDSIGLVYDRDIERADFVIGYDIQAFIMNYPLCMNHGVSRKMAERCGKSITDFMEECIEDDYYVHCLVDTYYISAYKETCGTSHFMHNILLYGYDGKRQIFYGADCFAEGKYSFEEVTYEEFERGFVISGFDWLEGIRLIKKRESPYIGIWYHIPHLKEQIRLYTTGAYVSCPIKVERPLVKGDDRYVYGAAVYDEVAAYVRLVYEEQRNFDVRIMYVLYDHARLMAYMSRQLCLRGQLEHGDDIHRLFRQLSDMIRELNINMIRFNLNSTGKAAEHACRRIMEAKELDIHAMEMFGECMLEEGKAVHTFMDRQSADSISVRETGVWKYRSGKTGVLCSRHKGDSLSCMFFGTEFSVSGYRHEKGGKCRVWVDGKIMGEADTGADKEEEAEIFRCSGMETGYHLAEVENLSGDGKMLMVESFEPGAGRAAAGSCHGENQGEFLGFDRSTGGKWDKRYGTAGYDIIGYCKKLPGYMTDTGYLVRDAAYVILVRVSAGDRGLRYGEKKENNIAAYYLQRDEFVLDITMAGEHGTEFYCADYDRLGRSFELVLEDGDNGDVIDRQTVEEYQGGVYLKYRLKGHVRARFKRLAGPDVTVSGVFWE